MEELHEYMDEYRRQLQMGVIQKAYQGLMGYMMDLRTHLNNKYPDYVVSSNIYYGYMDMTNFSFFPQSLGNRNLKIAVVFIHEAFRFEAWLAGYNKQIQTKYWRLFKESEWNKYRIVPTTKGADSILEYSLVEHPNFRDLDALTEQIERGALHFIKDVESFLSEH